MTRGPDGTRDPEVPVSGPTYHPLDMAGPESPKRDRTVRRE